MSRSLVSLVLGGTLLLITAACSPQPTPENNPANVKSPEAETAALEDVEAQGPQASSKPVVTVNLSPT